MHKIKAGSLMILFLLWGGVVCPAQQLGKERAKRLSISGRFNLTNRKLFPVEKTAGEIFIPPLTVLGNGDPGTIKALRLHFVVKRLEEAQRGTWRVLLSARDVQWEFDSAADPDAEEFWSPQLPGDSVTVQLFSTVPNSTLQLTIDQTIEYLEPIREKTIVGDNDMIEITKANIPKHKEWGRSVARVSFVTYEDDEKIPCTCTGFLVGPDLFMTNDHCPRSPKEKRSTVVEFDYDSEFAKTKMYRIKEELLRNEELDFALYRLNKAVTDRGFLKLKDEDQNLRDKDALVIIQHPGGVPKRLAAFKCQLRIMSAALDPPTDFAHECDTEGGSSGSPVQNNAGAVVGLHHFGFRDTADPALQFNQAVRMGAILNRIKLKDQRLYRSLTTPE